MKIPSCNGCVLQKQDCPTRDAFRAAVKGLKITTVRFRCVARRTEFPVGTPVWVETVDDYSVPPEEQYRGQFPGVVVRDLMGPRAVAFIRPGAAARDDEQIGFTPNARGFCKVPLNRLSRREGDPVRVCTSCEQPEGEGHASGYSCDAPIPMISWKGERHD